MGKWIVQPWHKNIFERNVPTISGEAYKKWEQKRKKTVIAFCIQTVLLGLDYSLLFLTLWAYLGQLDIEKPDRYYGLIAVSYLLVAVFFSVPICQLADRYRNIRVVIFLTNIAMIVGNLLYSMSFSPWFLVAGRIISGCGIPLRSVMAGEVARVYQHEDLTSVFSMIGMAFGFGFVIGPGINFAFDNLDSYIGNWHVTFANVSGLYVSIFFLLSQIMCYFMVYNVSKEYDLKAEMAKGKKVWKRPRAEDEIVISNSFHFNVNRRDNDEYLESFKSTAETFESSEIVAVTNGSTYGGFEHLVNYSFDMSSTEHGTPISNYKDNILKSPFVGECEKLPLPSNCEKTPLLSQAEPVQSIQLVMLLKKMLSNKDTVFMLVLAYFENFFSISFNMWLPMAVLTTLNWSMLSLNAIVLGTGIASIIPCLILIFIKFSDRQMFWLSTVCVGLLACLTSVYIVLAFYTSNLTLNVFLWVMHSVCYANIMIIKDIFLSGFLAKMLNSSIQSMGDSLRLSSQRIGAITALLLSPILYQHMKIVGFFYIVTVVILVVFMVLRRKTLGSPRVVI